MFAAIAVVVAVIRLQQLFIVVYALFMPPHLSWRVVIPPYLVDAAVVAQW